MRPKETQELMLKFSGAAPSSLPFLPPVSLRLAAPSSSSVGLQDGPLGWVGYENLNSQISSGTE
jgi:hypothetical protein